MKRDQIPWNSKKTKKTKQTNRNVRKSTVSICNTVINNVHALCFWMPLICWPQSLQTLRICLQRGCGSRWFIYSAVTFVSDYPSAVSSLFTLYGCSVLWCVYIDVESNQGCSRAEPFISKCALSAQFTQGTPTPSPDRPSKDKSQVLITTSINSCSTQVSIKTIPHKHPLSCMGNEGRSLPKTLPMEASKFCKSLGLLKSLCLVPDAVIQLGYTPGESS